jgi:lysyl-tRNA synthetase class 1
MLLSNPEFINTILDQFDRKEETFWEVEVAEALRKAGEQHSFSDQTQRDAWWAELAAFSFSLQEESVWATSYGPAFETAPDGKPEYSPDISDADSQTVEHWDIRSQQTANPILAARYSDLVWDFTSLVAKAKSPVEAARRAIDAYVKASKLIYKFATQPVQYLERALSLSLKISDKQRLCEVIEAMFDFHDYSSEPGSWSFLFEQLYNNKKIPLSEIQEGRIIAKLEEILAGATQFGGKEFDPFNAESAASKLAVHYSRKGLPREVARVIRAYGISFEKLAESAAPTLAMGWLQPVYDAYFRAGLREDATRVQLAIKLKGSCAREDMRTISANIEIPKEQMEQWLESVTSGGFESAMNKIAIEFITKTDRARALVRMRSTLAPLSAAIGIQKIADSQVVAQIGSTEGDPEGRIIWQLAQLIEMESSFLNLALKRVQDQYQYSAEDMVSFLSRSPIFDPLFNSLMEEGIEAYLKEDWVKAIHILVPQIENSLRRLLFLMGIPTNKPLRGSNTIMQEKTLNDIFDDPAIQLALEEDTLNYFRTFLNDTRGLNVRNRVAHGLCPRDFFSPLIADRLVHILLSLSRLNYKAEIETPQP